MLAIAALAIKKTVTLFALVGPVSMIPIFLSATEGLDPAARLRFARTIGVSVTVALLVAAFLGLLWPRLKGKDAAAIAVASAFVTLVAVPFVPAGIPIIVAAAVSGALAVAQHRRTP